MVEDNSIYALLRPDIYLHSHKYDYICDMIHSFTLYMRMPCRFFDSDILFSLRN